MGIAVRLVTVESEPFMPEVLTLLSVIVRFPRALWIVLTSKNTSPSHLQRRLQIDYLSAYQLIGWMERIGIVSAPDENGRRVVRDR
jgi:DNA segregation ATPase FtsK/SpoIIIE-like protein